jgi:hypothetical protein
MQCLLPGLVAAVLVLRLVNSPFCALASSTKYVKTKISSSAALRNSVINSPVLSVPTAR